MEEETQAKLKELARDHAIRVMFTMTCAAFGYDRTEVTTLFEGLVENIRREPFPTNDPAQSMLAADEIADAFADLLKPDEQSLALLDRLARVRQQ